MNKEERQKIIRQLITQNTIETQEELLDLLRKNGVKATQSTISRDARDLYIVKTYQENGTMKYSIVDQESQKNSEKKLRESLQESLRKIEQVGFVVLIHTENGLADVITNYIDEVNYEEIAGTIAGSDTIIIITHSDKMAQKVVRKFELLFKDSA
ncbi:ArgR family transcriptional regulator [Enterococcus silesiacus]|uniref:Arginine repressor n=1 Tax=Enterococcus silesiacus TaxID=332949 RepID=A0A0S3K9J8_9ENTE|nr:arginine repressor [Enterococcus silesiacus]ALS00916.1 ArgR family transcriptional regulator [Enterococcus silesiacus]OJG91663.1 arginine repressor [Enterococcus silesiacus]